MQTSDLIAAQECAAGFYCPAGSTIAKQTPADAGYYVSTTGQSSQTKCAVGT